jgi:2-oxoisovalerate dehydrogenase E1 component beta subunit
MTHIPGWKIVMPSNALDAYGLMIACMKDPNPTMYLKPKALLRTRGADLIPGEPEDPKVLSKMIDQPVTGDISKWKPQWPEGLTDYTVELGQAKICRTGEHLTIVSYGRTLPECVKVADTLLQEGMSVEVIDLRTLWPYDWQTVSESIRKTRRVLFVNEDTEVTNFGEHLMRRTVEELFYELEARPRVFAGEHLPGIGLADPLEMASVPQYGSILTLAREIVQERA